MAETTRPERGSRKDAQRNHGLLVASAREVFAERGVEAPLDEIARRAGVGIATLYGHFPTRDSLVEAIFAERVDEFLAVAQRALAEPDAWEGLVGFVEGLLELQSGDRVLKEIFMRYPPGQGRMAESRQQMRELFGELLTHAHEQGVLREDFVVSDLALLLWSFAPVIDATAEVAPEAWRRHLHWILDGLRPTAATAQVQKPLDEAQLTEAMQCLRDQRFQRRPGPPRHDSTHHEAPTTAVQPGTRSPVGVVTPDNESGAR